MKVSIFTTYTEPEKRRDPWEESLSCYRDYADEIIVTGKDWPFEFKWDLIGKTFQQGLDESTGDWAIRMDIDYLFHEKHIDVLRPLLKKFESFGIGFPQIFSGNPPPTFIKLIFTPLLIKTSWVFFKPILKASGLKHCEPT